MTPLSTNLAANLAAKLCTGLLTLGLVPVYVKLLGVESYGLVGLFATIQSVLLVLDLGLGTTLNRELARLSVQPERRGEARDLARTLELPYWGISALLLLLSWPVGSALASHWIQPETLSADTVRRSMVLMGFAVGLQFPSALYAGGLLGLQRQVLLSGLTVTVAVVRGAGSILVLLFVERSVEAYLAWQLATGVLQTALHAAAFWRSLPGDGSPARFRAGVLEGRGRFAGGVVGVTLLSLILTQTDKLLLSKLLSLEQFGYYALAAVAGGALNVMIGPLFSAVFPRFSQLVASGDEAGEVRLYHRSAQVMALLVLPAGAVLALFSGEFLLLWTGNPETAERTRLLVSVLAAGTALNGLMNIPYALQLAHGWTKLAAGVNVVSIAVLVPALWFLTKRWGALGAASAWAALNLGYVLFTMPLMHRRLLRGELARWYVADVGLPLAASLAAAAALRLAPFRPESLPGKAALVGAAAIASLAAAFLASGELRRMLRRDSLDSRPRI